MPIRQVPFCMNINRRELIGGGILGAVTVGTIGFFGGLFDTYKSDVLVENRQASSTTVELLLSNLDEDRTVLDESITLSPDEDFRKEGILSNETRYRITVETENNSAEKEFETCCRGFQISVYIERDETQILLGHYD